MPTLMNTAFFGNRGSQTGCLFRGTVEGSSCAWQLTIQRFSSFGRRIARVAHFFGGVLPVGFGCHEKLWVDRFMWIPWKTQHPSFEREKNLVLEWAGVRGRTVGESFGIRVVWQYSFGSGGRL
jgi:hypothetical protein